MLKHNPTVMVVDDCDDIREMLKVVLSELGCRVVEAVNGQEAVEVAQSELPDLILMDINMPVLDGFGAVRLIRGLAELCYIPIIAVSAHDTSEQRTQALDIGFNEYLTKPVDFARLDNVIDRFLKAA